MRIHFIAIGGSAMHNLALALHDYGHTVTGSDDEIYEPSRSRLSDSGLLPREYGWYTDKIEPNIYAIILGMHARKDNPELLRAQELGLKIYSYPEFVASQSMEKTRVVIAGSHGKTTTTSIILHALSSKEIEYDYLVGAQLDGFDRMVKLSDAGIIILEGDEYLSSPIDRRPKMMHYKPNIAVITGVAWDHINVFPTFDNYVDQFRLFINDMSDSDQLFIYEKDEHLKTLLAEDKHRCSIEFYDQINLTKENQYVVGENRYDIKLIGNHNMQNIIAAEKVCLMLGLTLDDFYDSLQTFTGANKRLQVLKKGNSVNGNIYLDFAHAPSKVKATTDAVKDWYKDAPLIAVFELHTFSSLNAEFLPQYKGALDSANMAFVIFSEHALEMKKMPALDKVFVEECFEHPNIKVFTNSADLRAELNTYDFQESNLLLMSSGTFDGMELDF
ncbi:MAG: UDP-N-acetylmuramate: L-alanyl-gamma-D-glutamyl-meso-diaminopimelate ligase [Saprospiraceae bacterium]|jgi:UDP-N-acetylmuramate: L-alanyl-gamma-D-glutamyl-meso-diaminopimelate ligase